MDTVAFNSIKNALNEINIPVELDDEVVYTTIEEELCNYFIYAELQVFAEFKNVVGGSYDYGISEIIRESEISDAVTIKLNVYDENDEEILLTDVQKIELENLLQSKILA